MRIAAVIVVLVLVAGGIYLFSAGSGEAPEVAAPAADTDAPLVEGDASATTDGGTELEVAPAETAPVEN
ncbi:MAG: hypothetical protein AAGE76_07895 [Pseudomonadota bacterium]